MAESLAYSIDEAAVALGVSRGTVYNAMRKGELRSFTIGTRRLISREALAELTAPTKPAEPSLTRP